jgi:cation transporter-like permease
LVDSSTPVSVVGFARLVSRLIGDLVGGFDGSLVAGFVGGIVGGCVAVLVGGLVGGVDGGLVGYAFVGGFVFGISFIGRVSMLVSSVVEGSFGCWSIGNVNGLVGGSQVYF